LTNSAVKYAKTSQRSRGADKLCKAGVGSHCHARVALAAQRPAALNTHEYATVACIGWSCSRRQQAAAARNSKAIRRLLRTYTRTVPSNSSNATPIWSRV